MTRTLAATAGRSARDSAASSSPETAASRRCSMWSPPALATRRISWVSSGSRCTPATSRSRSDSGRSPATVPSQSTRASTNNGLPALRWKAVPTSSADGAWPRMPLSSSATSRWESLGSSYRVTRSTRSSSASSGRSGWSRCSSSDRYVTMNSSAPVPPRLRIRKASRSRVDWSAQCASSMTTTVVGALAVAQARVDLAGLGVDQERLEELAVPLEQGVGQRAVAPEDPLAVQVDEQAGDGVEQPLAVLDQLPGEPAEQPPELPGVLQVLGDQDRVAGVGLVDQADRSHRRELADLEGAHHPVLLVGDPGGQLLEGV